MCGAKLPCAFCRLNRKRNIRSEKAGISVSGELLIKLWTRKKSWRHRFWGHENAFESLNVNFSCFLPNFDLARITFSRKPKIKKKIKKTCLIRLEFICHLLTCLSFCIVMTKMLRFETTGPCMVQGLQITNLEGFQSRRATASLFAKKGATPWRKKIHTVTHGNREKPVFRPVQGETLIRTVQELKTAFQPLLSTNKKLHRESKGGQERLLQKRSIRLSKTSWGAYSVCDAGKTETVLHYTENKTEVRSLRNRAKGSQRSHLSAEA